MTAPGWLPGDPGPGWTPTPPRTDPVPPTVVHLDPWRAELAEQLWRRRVILLSGRLDGPAAEAAVGRILLADADGPDPIQLHLNCPDGDLDAAVVLTETLQLVRARVIALAGTVGGPVVGAYAAARVRRAHPHARFVLSEPRAALRGSAGKVAVDAELQAGQWRFLQEMIAMATGRDLGTGRVLTAAEAQEAGLVHEIVGQAR